ncbi:hypothetical protein PsorP6_009263 [Peronosclerospora sorghi]|uniref:Uncharacterized protein n=1 Tax=Peronosclerospora sorghi TaxID=230839 RepID=A0ACC0W1B4_9STRA|nr:hypothetical protein PsorP6_009263 [Peronosclerospora sorghi]
MSSLESLNSDVAVGARRCVLFLWTLKIGEYDSYIGRYPKFLTYAPVTRRDSTKRGIEAYYQTELTRNAGGAPRVQEVQTAPLTKVISSCAHRKWFRCLGLAKKNEAIG